MVDQTVHSRKTTLHKKKRKSAVKKSEVKVKVVPGINRETEYGRAYLDAIDILNQANQAKGSVERVEKYLESALKFEQAALYAEDDSKLLEVLKQRNMLHAKAVKSSIKLVNEKISSSKVAENLSELLGLLEKAETLTHSKKLLNQITSLRDSLVK